MKTLHFTKENAILSREGFLANRSQLLVAEQEQMTIDFCGEKCSGQSLKFPRHGLWQRMFLDYLVSTKAIYSKRCVLTWKTKVTKYKRLLFQLAVSMPRTEEIEYGLLPTVQMQGLKVCVNGQSKFLKLGMLNTPTRNDAKNIYFPKSQIKRDSLVSDIMRLQMLPTPTAIDRGSGRINKNVSKNSKERPTIALMARRGLLPTPLASDNGEKVTGLEKQESLTKITRNMTGKTSQLNPQFVAEMMGFPNNWTELPFLNTEENQ